jgi:hypothetical protein
MAGRRRRGYTVVTVQLIMVHGFIKQVVRVSKYTHIYTGEVSEVVVGKGGIQKLYMRCGKL